MKFYIVTPSYNALYWLQGCVRSIADQVGETVQVHHHVQDGGSTDGTQAWLEAWQKEHENTPRYKLTYESGKDAGMYDALNIAWSKLPEDADVTAHLNCDEQYLPDALKKVGELLLLYPDADVMLTSHIAVSAQGKYVCHRRPVKPVRWISDTASIIQTCVCFYRANSFRRFNTRYDIRLRAMADMAMYKNLVRANCRFVLRPDLFTSVFAMTGDNLGWETEIIKKDFELLRNDDPAMNSWFNRHLPWRFCSLIRLLKDFAYPAPRYYDIFVEAGVFRQRFTIEKPTARWGYRMGCDVTRE